MPERVQDELIRRVSDLETQIERFRRSEQFLQASEANLHLFARSLAHDFNNLIAAISGHAVLIRDASPRGGHVHEAASIIEKASGRATELAAQLLHFTRGGLGRLVPVDIHETIRDVHELLKRTIDPDITVKLSLNADDGFIEGDPGQIHQMLLNLALNARDAMPDGGELTFTTREESVPGVERSDVVVEVRDTGCGIPPDLHEKVFQPFFSTKSPDQGSGMGLAIVSRVVQNHGGAICMDSAPTGGTRFQIRLPQRHTAAKAKGAGR